jgi:hypothetical protein
MASSVNISDRAADIKPQISAGNEELPKVSLLLSKQALCNAGLKQK